MENKWLLAAALQTYKSLGYHEIHPEEEQLGNLHYPCLAEKAENTELGFSGFIVPTSTKIKNYPPESIGTNTSAHILTCCFFEMHYL